MLHERPAELALGLAFVAVLAPLTLTDLERGVIPNAVLLAGALICVPLVSLTDPASLVERAIAAAGAGGFLLALAVAYPRGMGMGDVKLAALMGLYLGSAVVPALAIAACSGTLVGLVLMASRGSGARKLAIPFGPFLALGGVVALLWGQQLIDWYLRTFV